MHLLSETSGLLASDSFCVQIKERPYRELQRNLGDAGLNALREVKVMILEENESFVARAGYVDQLRAVVSRP